MELTRTYEDLPQRNPNEPDSIKIAFGHEAEGLLKVFDFMDHGYHIMYVPSLKLSAYGKTKEEARQMLSDVVLFDFFEQLINMAEGEAFQHLSRLGWTIRGFQERVFENAAYVDKNGVLQNFNLPEDTPIEQELITV